jgi:hypothetical protein
MDSKLLCPTSPHQSDLVIYWVHLNKVDGSNNLSLDVSTQSLMWRPIVVEQKMNHATRKGMIVVVSIANCCSPTSCAYQTTNVLVIHV